MKLPELPAIRNSYDAERLAETLTSAEYIFLSGARAALQRLYDMAGLELRRLPHSTTYQSDRRAWFAQQRADLAFQMQMIRETLEASSIHKVFAEVRPEEVAP
jgi:hypothetical protein